ncbi:hypothetical protein CRG98_030500 [Punica granatum]|uniref:Uncharacterized protein n=1 Tax=Punica granatum TaxID=22663 RepID=A0A2I0IYU7_PUNGR|nr:hypothetical protein CRG98_030500 [Punica granatum]
MEGVGLGRAPSGRPLPSPSEAARECSGEKGGQIGGRGTPSGCYPPRGSRRTHLKHLAKSLGGQVAGERAPTPDLYSSPSPLLSL